MRYYIEKTLKGNFEEVIAYVTDSLKKIGFGIVSTINVQATLKEKINQDFKPYIILGACNPHFAHKGLQLEDKLGVLLPCNVVVTDQGGGIIEVAAMDPAGLIEQIKNPELTEMAEEVSLKMEEMIRQL